MQLTVVDNITSLQQSLIEASKAGKRVAFVPTMGALHAGHMALVEAAKQHADYVVVSIFVNPRQFSPTEDYSNYPRTLEQDIKKLDEAGVGLLYTPTVEDMYPMGFTTTVSPGALGNILCGKFRPGHFDGVATVVTKLLLRILPHVTVFGEKDFQQLFIIRQLVYDLDIPMEIIGLPTVREADGLAISSRNAYLTAEERKTAPVLFQILTLAASRLANEKMDVPIAMGEAMAKLVQAGFKVDYLELRYSDTLEPMVRFERPCRILAAVWLGKTRLIDNVALE